MASMGPLFPGHTLQHGRYTIIDREGQGGFGYVYKASDNSWHGRIVAIKELKQDGLLPEDLPEERRLFQQEAAILQQLSSHPHIPQYYDYFTDQGRYFIVMEFIEGQTLQALIYNSQAQQIPVGQVISYGIQLCSALSHLHQQFPPIISRDLKPANVKVTADGRAYLLDFGIAREYKQGKDLDTTIRYTEGYAAPEASREQTEPRSDLYSLGAVLHHCLTGHNPRDNNPTLFNFRPARTFNLQVPPALDNLIQQLVATQKEKRPLNAAAVSLRLETIQRGASGPTQPLPFNAILPKLPFFNWQTAIAAQLRILRSQRNILLSLASLCPAILILFCSALGDKVRFVLFPWMLLHWQKLWKFTINAPHRFLSQCKQLSAKLVIAFPQPQPQPGNHAIPAPQQFRQRNRLVHVILDNSGEIARDIKGIIDPQIGVSPNLVPFVGVFAIVACCTIGMLAVLHLSLYVVLFILAVILLLISFSASIQRTIDGQVQHMLVAVMIAALLSCLALAYLPDVKHMLAAITVNLLFCFLTGAFVLASLFRSTRRNIWVDHVTIIVIAIACAAQQYLLGVQEWQSLMPSIASSADVVIFEIIAIIVLSIIACIAFVAINEPYGKRRFLFSVILIACVDMLLQFAFGKQDIPEPVQHAMHAQLTLFTLIFIVVLGISMYMASRFFFPKAERERETKQRELDIRQNRQTVPTVPVNRVPWERMGRTPLVFIIIPCLLLQYYVGTTYSRQTPNGFTQFLQMRPLDLTRINQSIVFLLLLMGIMLFLCWFRHCSSMPVNMLASAGIGITCMLLHTTLWDSNSTLALLPISQYTTPFLAGIVTITLLLLTISVSLHLFQLPTRFSWLITRNDQLMRISGYAILTMCAFLCTSFFWAYGNQLPELGYSPPIQDIRVTIGQFAAVIMAIVTGVAFIMLFTFFCQLLRPLPARGNMQANAIPPWDRRRRWNMTCRGVGIFFDGLLLLILLSSLLFITLNVQEWQPYRYPALPFVVTRAFALIPLPLWLAEFGLLVIVGFSFFRLDPNFEKLKHAAIKLFFVLALIGKALATACMILLFASVWPTFIMPLFALLEGICLILLIQTVLLITWAEKERPERENWRGN
ncbi:MAG: serine/threonine-protein kinase [Ktedonobacteraceae bacterium]